MLTPFVLASSVVLCITVGSPACIPHAILAEAIILDEIVVLADPELAEALAYVSIQIDAYDHESAPPPGVNIQVAWSIVNNPRRARCRRDGARFDRRRCSSGMYAA